MKDTLRGLDSVFSPRRPAHVWHVLYLYIPRLMPLESCLITPSKVDMLSISVGISQTFGCARWRPVLPDLRTSLPIQLRIQRLPPCLRNMAPKRPLKRRQDDESSPAPTSRSKKAGKNKREVTYDTYDEAMDGESLGRFFIPPCLC